MSFASFLKAEISCLSRRSMRPIFAPLRKDVVSLKHTLASQKRTIAQLQRDNARLVVDLNARLAAPPTAAATEVQCSRLSPRLIRSQRKRLGLSSASFAKLVGVSGNTVVAWEGGKTKPRAGAKAVLVAIRGLGRREARQRLEILAGGNGLSKKKSGWFSGTG